MTRSLQYSSGTQTKLRTNTPTLNLSLRFDILKKRGRWPRLTSIMPIFEYSCDDCGTRFEKLVRRSSAVEDVTCPSCGHDHLHQEYSTFAAHAHGAKSEAAPMGCGAGMCQSGFCGSGAGEMN
jgi:putative FmdB family regulatory protein